MATQNTGDAFCLTLRVIKNITPTTSETTLYSILAAIPSTSFGAITEDQFKLLSTTDALARFNALKVYVESINSGLDISSTLEPGLNQPIIEDSPSCEVGLFENKATNIPQITYDSSSVMEYVQAKVVLAYPSASALSVIVHVDESYWQGDEDWEPNQGHGDDTLTIAAGSAESSIGVQREIGYYHPSNKQRLRFSIVSITPFQDSSYLYAAGDSVIVDSNP